ncbi:MAG: N-acyl-L-homoserine lactone synthetase [Desulfobacterium sp.]|nr:N-acyl-L-homoserine lactone synthetase [Desulfobacterium sp.]
MIKRYLERQKKKFVRSLPDKIRCKLIWRYFPPFKAEIDNIVFRCAESVDDYIKAFRLVHDVYVQEGYIDPAPSALRITPYHNNPSSRVFLGMYQECGCEIPIYTISMFPDSDDHLGLPMDMAFKRELDVLRDKGRSLVEIGALASAPAFRNGDMNIPMLGNRIIQRYAFEYLHCDDIVITVHPKHRWVYRDILLFEELGYVDQYDYVRSNPAVAMRLDLRTAEEKYQRAYGAMPREKNLYTFFFGQDSSSICFPKSSRINNKNLVNSIYQYAFSCGLIGGRFKN